MTSQLPHTTTLKSIRHTSKTVAVSLLIWLLTVIITAQSGLLSRLYLPLISGIVAATIALPTLCYFQSKHLQAWVKHLGLRRVVSFHIWRIPAAVLFFYFGLKGELPVVFWVLAGGGDLIAGSYAAYVITKPNSTLKDYQQFHVVGFADFIVAVGTGLTYTLLQNPQIATITVLPMALIPLFGVGISGASHLVSFDILKNH